MKIKLLFPIFIFFGIYLLCFQTASACSCIASKPPCGGVDKSAIIFTGKVIKVTVDEGERTLKNREFLPFIGKKAQFKVTESLNNIKTKEIVVETGLGGGDCGYDFKEGEEYLVYAHEYKGRILTGICSRTQLLSEAQNDLEILRQIKSNKTVPTYIFGRIMTNSEDDYEVKTLSGVRVSAKKENGRNYETVTDDKGSYRFIDLPIGKYNIQAIHKENFTKNAEIAIKSVKGEQCIEEDFFFYEGGRITGKVIDNEGKPIAKLKVHAERLVFSPEDEKGQGLYWGYTDEKGNYEIEGLQKGKYILGINYKEPIKKDFPFPPTYYPSGKTPDQAENIIVTTEKSFDEYNFRLPLRIKPRLITGVLLFPDGKPVTEGRVKVKEERTTWEMDSADVSKDGKFTLSIFEGQSYYFYAYKDFASWGMNKEVKKIYIPKTGEIQPLKITIPLSKK